MKHLFIALLLLTAVAPAAVSAQEVNNSTVSDAAEEAANATTSEDPVVEAIDSNTAILSARYVSGEVVLVIRSDRPQVVTLTDAGGVLEGGEIDRKKVRLLPGENRVSMPVTEVSGRVAVTIDTGDVLYAKNLDTGSSLITGPYSAEDVQNSALAGLFAGLGVTALIAFRRVRGMADGPERLL